MPRYELIDTHTHLCDPVFDNDREAVLARAQAAGVATIITVSENLTDAQRNLELVGQYPQVKAAAGLYPSYLDMTAAEEMITFIRGNREKFVAIGEVGLDFWLAKEENEKEMQKEIFARFIALSLELDLPLNVHSRSAGRHAVALLLEKGARRVQMHAFDGKASAAMPAVEAGFFFSVPPSVVRSLQKQKLVKQLPLSCLLIETDSPVLGPVPQERNEPANVLIVVDAIAQLKNISKEDVMKAALENTTRLYSGA